MHPAAQQVCLVNVMIDLGALRQWQVCSIHIHTARRHAALLEWRRGRTAMRTALPSYAWSPKMQPYCPSHNSLSWLATQGLLADKSPCPLSGPLSGHRLWP